MSGALRAVVEVLQPAGDAYSRMKVRLECGHEVWCDGGVIYRTRCRHCAPTSAAGANGPEANPMPDGAEATGSDEHQPRAIGAPAKGER